MATPEDSAPHAAMLGLIRAAAARIAPHAHVTPVFTASSLDALAGHDLFFKMEVRGLCVHLTSPPPPPPFSSTAPTHSKPASLTKAIFQHITS
jgi:hypothetical protein